MNNTETQIITNDQKLKYIGECVLRAQARKNQRDTETQEFRANVGTILKGLRQQLRLSQSAIAAKVGVSYQTILHFEQGKNSRWFNVVASGYKTAIECFVLADQIKASKLSDIQTTIK